MLYHPFSAIRSCLFFKIGNLVPIHFFFKKHNFALDANLWRVFFFKIQYRFKGKKNYRGSKKFIFKPFLGRGSFSEVCNRFSGETTQDLDIELKNDIFWIFGHTNLETQIWNFDPQNRPQRIINPTNAKNRKIDLKSTKNGWYLFCKKILIIWGYFWIYLVFRR